jgi:hypothetical protein
MTRSLGWLALCTFVLTLGQAKAEALMVPAVAPWSADGKAYLLASDKLLFQGEFRGILYFSGSEGVLDASPFTCPVRQIVEVETGRSEATGHCVFQGRDDALVFADWTCEGMVGACEGLLEIRGGTGHLAGIEGRSKMLVRTALSFTGADLSSGAIEKSAEGIAIWPALEIRLPGTE